MTQRFFNISACGPLPSLDWRRLRPIGLCAAAALLALGQAGCSRVSMNDVTGSITGAPTQLPKDEASLRRMADDWGARYESNRKDKRVAMTYASALRALERNAQAVAVLQGLAIQNPKDMEVLAAYGKALSDAGQLQQAAEVLARAHTPENPNWSVLSAQGAVADKLGAHEQAQQYYETALKIRPGEPSIMSNLGLSYALSRNLPRAEATLREAAAQPKADMRVRQNLALVLALQGKFGEAEEWSRRDLSPADATANVAQIRSMIAQSNTWRSLQAMDGGGGGAQYARPPAAKPRASRSAGQASPAQ